MWLISGVNSNLRWGHSWTRNSARGIAIFRNKINALLDFESEVTVARDFTGKLRDELLNGEIFYTLKEARITIEAWRRHYNPASQHPSVYVIEVKRPC